MTTRIVLATTDPDYDRRLRAAYAGALNGDLKTLSSEVLGIPPAQAVEAIAGDAANAPEVVALGPGLDIDAALELARRFDLDRPEVSVVLIAEPTPDLWARAARAGVRDILDPSASSAVLHEAFERASETALHRRANLAIHTGLEAPTGHVITIVSPKGGSGKTTMATNLAVGLAQQYPEQVVIVDLDLQFGDVASALQLIPEHTIADAARVADTLDATTLKIVLTPHNSGLYALAAPETPAEGERITGAAVTAILERLAKTFRFVIVDTSAGLTESTLSALEVSTDIGLMCSMDVPSVRSLRKVVDALDQVGMTEQTRHLVLNRADTRVGMETRDVEATVGLHVDVAVPSSRAVPLAINQGIPLILSDPKHPVSKELAGFVARFADPPDHKGPFWRFKR